MSKVLQFRPTCQQEGCKNPAMWMGKCRLDGTRIYRRTAGKYICGTHHNHNVHPYLKYRKDYCQNIDGRLGFTCTTTIFWPGMLDTDHRNGNPSDNRPRNLQTLCKCCHAYKTHKNKDFLTPGRKALKAA
jgi:hypothetical protein